MGDDLSIGMDCAFRSFTGALIGSDGSVIAQKDAEKGQKTVEAISACFSALLREADGRPIGRLATISGPGSFTGLRTGLAFAQGFARTRNLEVLGLPSLFVLGRLFADADRPTLVLMDARGGAVYAQWFPALSPGRARGARGKSGAHEVHPLAQPRRIMLGDLPSFATMPRFVVTDEDLRAKLAKHLPTLGATTDVSLCEGPPAPYLARLALRLDPKDFPPRPVYLADAHTTPSKRHDLVGNLPSGAFKA